MLLGRDPDGAPIELSIDRLISSNLAVLANPGAGKSRTIRRVLEIAAGRAQRIALDVEDEFYTLREASPNLIIAGGDNGDCPAEVANAAQLARFILEAGVDAVIQLNDLGLDGQQEFIAEFLEAMTSAPKALWHPALVVLDEAHRLAPESGYSAARDAIVGFLTKGRKRGYTAILAAPRNALISKNVTGAVNNWLLGRVGQSTDRAVAADALGFPRNSAEARGLIGLPEGHFWGFGPAIAPVPVLIKIEPSSTTHLRPGHRDVPTPPAPEEIRAMMERMRVESTPETASDEGAKINTDPAELAAVKEQRNDLRRQLQEAHGRINYLERRLQVEQQGYRERSDGIRKIVQQALEDLSHRDFDVPAPHRPQPNDDDIDRSLDADEMERRSRGSQPTIQTGTGTHGERQPAQPKRESRDKPGETGTITTGARRMLAVLARGIPLTWEQTAMLARLKARGGNFNTARKGLRDGALITEEAGILRITEIGKEFFGTQVFEVAPATAREVVDMWRPALPGTAGRMLDYLFCHSTNWVPKSGVAAELNIQPRGGNWNTIVKALRDSGLIEVDGQQMRTSPNLWKMAVR